MDDIAISKSTDRIVIGCQGWNYTDWTTRDVADPIFYPRGTRSGEMLQRYARIFSATEIDSTFYAIPPVSHIEKWVRDTPDGFLFSPKMPQEITHVQRLGADSFPILEEFCDRIRGLGEKLSVCLIQLPPQFEATRPNAVRLRQFLARLPRDIRFAVEFRRPEWLVDWTFAELRKNAVTPALVSGKWVGRDLMFRAARAGGAGFGYVRFMGERDLESFAKIVRPQDSDLGDWSNLISEFDAERVFVYFSNLYEGHAPESVRKLSVLLGIPTTDPRTLEDQAALF